MSYEPAALSSALAAAVGDDHALVAELRGVFLESAGRHLVTLKGAADDAEWRDAALRMKGLAASFGASALMDAASRAGESGRDAASLAMIESAVATLF